MGPEKAIGYPLAILGSFALFSQPPTPLTGLGGAEGAGGSLRAAPALAQGAPSPIAASTVSPPALPAPPGRPSAESAELRALRMSEGTMFPEYGQPRLDLNGSIPGPTSCEDPDYDLVKSMESEIPSAGDWLRGLKRPDIAVPRDPKVARYLKYFATTPQGRETFGAWLRRSGAYREVVSAALHRRQLPMDLMAVMFVESGCWPKAVSSAGAAGLWQFMPQTARAYGLTVRRDYDERRSIWKSTEAALTHLADLNAQFESWHLALAAYNLGYQQLTNRLQSTRTEDFFSLARIPEALPRETALYVPKVLAIAVILRNLEYFGFDGIEPKVPLSASRIEVPPNTEMSLLARAAGTSLRKLRDLNPQILGATIPDTGSPIFVHLPNSGIARAKTMLPRLLDEGVRGSLDLQVTSDFDWGRDEVDSNWRTRLDRTKPGAAEPDAEDSDRSNSVSEAAKSSDSEIGEASRRRAEGNGKRTEGAGALARTTNVELPVGSTSGTPVRSNRDDSTSLRNSTNSNPGLSSRSNGSSSSKSRGRPQELAHQGESKRSTGSEPIFYRIKPGDTLSQLAKEFRVPWKDLAIANKLPDPSLILAGTTIRIAVAASREKRR